MMDDAFLADLQGRMAKLNEATTISADDAECVLRQLPPPSSIEIVMFLLRTPNDAFRTLGLHRPWWRFWG